MAARPPAGSDTEEDRARRQRGASRVDVDGSAASAPPGVRRRVGRRLAWWTAGTGIVIGLGLVAVFLPLERVAVERVAVDQLGLLAEAVAATYDTAASDGGPADEFLEEERDVVVGPRRHAHHAQEILDQLARANGVRRIDVTDGDGVVRKSTLPARVGERAGMGSRLRDVQREEALSAGGEPEDLIVVRYHLPFTSRCAVCHAASVDPVGSVHVVVSAKTAMAGFERFNLLLGFALLAGFIIIVGFLIFATDRLVARPVFRLARTMQRAEQGDFLVRAPVTSDDEVGALAAAFNRMLRAITSLQVAEVERDAAVSRAEAEGAVKGKLEDAARQLQTTNAQLVRRVRAQELLMEAAHRLGSTLDKSALLERLGRLISDKLERRDFALFLIVEGEDHEPELQAVQASGALDRDEVRAARFRVGDGVTGQVAETGAPIVIHDLAAPGSRKMLALRGLITSGSFLSIPLLHKGRVVGVLDVHAPEAHAFDHDDVALVQALGAQAAMAVVNADLYQTTLDLSVTDTLTGIMNRRALNRVLESELVRAQRFNTPMGVLMLDVDHFKQYNDRMGHLLGDEALQAVAQTLQSSIRKVDAIARFGGEEFCVVLPRTDEAASLDVAEKLLRAVRAIAPVGAEDQPLGHMSISVGVAMYPDDLPAAVDGTPADVILGLADRAAYEAKARGRDRVVCAADVTGRKRKPKLNEPSLVGR